MQIKIERLWSKEVERTWNNKKVKSTLITIGSGGKYYTCFSKPAFCRDWKEGDTIDYPIEVRTYKDKATGEDKIGYNIVLPNDTDLLFGILKTLQSILAKLEGNPTETPPAKTDAPTSDDEPPYPNDNDIPF